MKKLISLIALGLIVSVSLPAGAGEQQSKMKSCNADAKEKALKGDERKMFMKGCLSKDGGAPADAAKATQREKMKACNAGAKDRALKGDERKAFMSQCLKG
ncbi:MAG: hypothetical protein HY849_01420 [Nitrosomonadales bacterium]|nr:hypothetical protein [Nitrosomonadales bacterium]